MLHVIFSVDYEIHGNGDGDPKALMVEPTARMLRLLEEYGAKLTIMADVAEILRFKEYAERTGRDDYGYQAIVEQLLQAIASGHDVQLHIHSSYFNAVHQQDCWAQDWSEYDFAMLPYERMDWMVKTCKEYLESLLKPVKQDYACMAFRAANWSVSPSTNVVRALLNNRIEIDTSVWKFGRRNGAVKFDYSSAPSALLPWRASEADICVPDRNGRLWEIPIYTEKRWLGAFLARGRLYRVMCDVFHKGPFHLSQAKAGQGEPSGPGGPRRRSRLAALKALFDTHAWKADFNQCDGRQLVKALQRAERLVPQGRDLQLPFVLIGHSKLFTPSNEGTLRPFLAHIARHSDRFAFGTLQGMGSFHRQWAAL
ncbi:hypothetical protein [Azohydromonas aeria]|uniref:hypothetical protein n=1 Tax=Azohydromonas aeria TaxID=2590212 RepID=UPI0012F9E825|nr:hypothetical protein [Azohydromonas aeria]